MNQTIMNVGDVIVGTRKRPLNESRVASLQASIAEIGLLQPIVVTDRCGLVAGRHRLEAVRRLGWRTVPARIAAMNELQVELAEIDENLMRQELTVLEEAEHLARRDEILVALGSRATVGGQPGNRNALKNEGETVAPSFSIRTTTDLAAEMGIGKRSAQSRLQIARAIDPEVKEAIAAEPIADRTRDLLDLARLEPEEQRRVVAVEGVKEGRVAVRYARRKLGAERAAERARGRETTSTGGTSSPVRLIVGDAAALDLPDESVDVIVTSPPYNLSHEEWPMGGHGRVRREQGIGYQDDMDDGDYVAWQLVVLAELYRVAKPGASLFYNHKTRTTDGRLWHPMTWLSGVKGWTIRQEIVWDREVTHNHSATLFWPTDERIYWMTKGKPTLYGGSIGMPTVWRFHGPQPHTWHPAPFVEELPRRCLQAVGGSGLVVLDPFAGSCTTLRAAAALGHEAIGVDSCTEYLERVRVDNEW